jgi:hypothetical protein
MFERIRRSEREAYRLVSATAVFKRAARMYLFDNCKDSGEGERLGWHTIRTREDAASCRRVESRSSSEGVVTADQCIARWGWERL